MRRKRNILLRPGTWLVLLALLAAPGCGSNELESPTAIRLGKLAGFYLDCAVAKNGKGPANEKALKGHIRSIPGFSLQASGVDPAAIDSLFVSDRDQEPFVVLYGLTIAQVSGTKAPLVAHEKTGKNGKRLVGFANAKVELVDEARLQELIAGNQ
jgi:hypothetical protein